jgi:hypothetical protein
VGQRLAVGEQDAHRGGIGIAPPAGEVIDLGLDVGDGV